MNLETGRNEQYLFEARCATSNASKAGGIIGKLNYNLYTPGRDRQETASQRISTVINIVSYIGSRRLPPTKRMPFPFFTFSKDRQSDVVNELMTAAGEHREDAWITRLKSHRRRPARTEKRSFNDESLKNWTTNNRTRFSVQLHITISCFFCFLHHQNWIFISGMS